MFARFITSFGGYVIGGLAVICVFLGLGWYTTSNKLETCRDARKTDKALYEKAQADAEVLWMKKFKEKEKEYEAKANEADAAYGDLASKYRDAVRVYIDAQGKARTTARATTGASPSSDNGPSASPFIPDGAITETELDITEVAIVPVNDLLICAENTARLVVARDWALKLNE